MNCDEYQQQVSKLLDNAHEKGKAADVFSHLGVCESCREFFESTMQIRLAMRSAGPLPMSEAMDVELLQKAPFENRRIRDRGAIQRLGQHRSLRSRISTFALLIMVTLFIGLLFSVNISAQGPPEPIPQELVQPR
jgi:predicted anti-sigma-YlaC factor YlaD